jgi:hypothetical protein
LTITYGLSGTSDSSVISPTESSTRLSSVTQQEKESDKPNAYVTTESDDGLTTYEASGTSDSSVVLSTESSTRSSTVTQHEKENGNPITYTATESYAEPSTRSSSNCCNCILQEFYAADYDVLKKTFTNAMNGSRDPIVTL